jgi:proteasome lid subunit RPN8/RPN11
MNRCCEVPGSVLRAVVAHARVAMPAEACGLLLGEGLAISDAVPTRNLSETPTRYRIDPQAHVSALRQARANGDAVVGFYHSHPHSAPTPSERDVAEAAYPGAIYLIVGAEDGEFLARAYHFNGTSFDPLSLVTTGR